MGVPGVAPPGGAPAPDGEPDRRANDTYAHVHTRAHVWQYIGYVLRYVGIGDNVVHNVVDPATGRAWTRLDAPG